MRQSMGDNLLFKSVTFFVDVHTVFVFLAVEFGVNARPAGNNKSLTFIKKHARIGCKHQATATSDKHTKTNADVHQPPPCL